VFLVLDGLEVRVWGEREQDGKDGDEKSEDEEESEEEEDRDEEDAKDEPDAEDDDDANTSAFATPPTHPPSPTPPPPSLPTLLLSSERALSRHLSSLPSLDTELAPTRAHVLLRAPRRFTHPAWVPRARDGVALDAALCGARRKGLPTDVVRVALGAPLEGASTSILGALPAAPLADELDEHIWWGWDGPLAGFADW
jgi:hypothetical protein